MAAITINVSNVNASPAAQKFVGTALQAITSGQPVYADTLAGVSGYRPANSLLSNGIAGLAEGGATVNQQFLIVQKDPNFGLGGPINSGNLAIVGNVAGQINDVADRATGWYLTALGVGIGGNRINFSMVGSNAAM